MLGMPNGLGSEDDELDEELLDESNILNIDAVDSAVGCGVCAGASENKLGLSY